MTRLCFARSISLALCLLAGVGCGGSSASAPAGANSPLQGMSPGDAYAAYNSEISNASDLPEILPYMSRAYRAKEESAPKNPDSPLIETIKQEAPIGLRIDGQEITGNRATVRVSGTVQREGHKREQPATGLIVMVKEDGVWKVDQETWTEKK